MVSTSAEAKKEPEVNPNQLNSFSASDDSGNVAPGTQASPAQHEAPASSETQQNEVHPQQEPTVMLPAKPQPSPFNNPDVPTVTGEQTTLQMGLIDREAITKFINDWGYLTFLVRGVKINNYLKSLLSLATILTQSNIFAGANDEIENEVIAMMHGYS